MTVFSLHPAAGEELLAGVRWYKLKGDALAERFVAAFESTMEFVCGWPGASPQIEAPIERPRLRRARVRDFPYSVAYYIREDDTVRVVAVAHQKRRPLYWLSRLAGAGQEEPLG